MSSEVSLKLIPREDNVSINSGGSIEYYSLSEFKLMDCFPGLRLHGYGLLHFKALYGRDCT